MELMDVIKNRRAVREYTDAEIDRETIERLIWSRSPGTERDESAALGVCGSAGSRTYRRLRQACEGVVACKSLTNLL